MKTSDAKHRSRRLSPNAKRRESQSNNELLETAHLDLQSEMLLRNVGSMLSASAPEERNVYNIKYPPKSHPAGLPDLHFQY
jgi:hypothetical protein